MLIDFVTFLQHGLLFWLFEGVSQSLQALFNGIAAVIDAYDSEVASLVQTHQEGSSAGRASGHQTCF